MKFPDFVKIGHRGAPAHRPENTLSSFSCALEMGVDMIEMDLRLTKDNHVIVMHDGDVRRTTSWTGKVSDLTLEEIRKLDAGNGEKVPTLIDVIKRFKNKCLFGFDIVSLDVIEPLVMAIQDYNIVESSTIHSSGMHLLKWVRVLDPGITSVASFKELTFRKDSIVTAAELGAVFNPKLMFVSRNLIRLAHKFDMRIFTWTLNRKETVQILKKWGIDGIATDDPEVFY